MSGDWERDLSEDLDVIVAWRAAAVVSVIERHELVALGVADLGERVHERGMRWYHLPVPDGGVPDHGFEQTWSSVGAELRRDLRNGKKLLIHCKGGLGRTGMIAARLLVELGERAEDAVKKVRLTRKGAIETLEQERHVLRCRRVTE